MCRNMGEWKYGLEGDTETDPAWEAQFLCSAAGVHGQAFEMAGAAKSGSLP